MVFMYIELRVVQLSTANDNDDADNADATITIVKGTHAALGRPHALS